MSSDIEELIALNRDYVASVQNCDVKRFHFVPAEKRSTFNAQLSTPNERWRAIHYQSKLT